MNKKFFMSFSIFAVAAALVLGAGYFNTAKAIWDRRGDAYFLPFGEVNMYGYGNPDPATEKATNTIGVQRDRDRDADSRDRSSDFPQYGLGMQSQE